MYIIHQLVASEDPTKETMGGNDQGHDLYDTRIQWCIARVYLGAVQYSSPHASSITDFWREEQEVLDRPSVVPEVLLLSNSADSSHSDSDAYVTNCRKSEVNEVNIVSGKLSNWSAYNIHAPTKPLFLLNIYR